MAKPSFWTGLFAGQARSHRYSTLPKVCAVPVGAGLSREEANEYPTNARLKPRLIIDIRITSLSHPT
ncbi:hypothetical protein C1X72_04975 [Pseudomonas sp. FW306-2-2C-D06B]|nr:hypothetical protein C1X72_04975 [Pseudomonas sp. FW306-2-2C-D06B]PYG97942.1 hypothetical protein CVV67_23980 [Arthrobacter stackebrandtii]